MKAISSAIIVFAGAFIALAAGLFSMAEGSGDYYRGLLFAAFVVVLFGMIGWLVALSKDK